MRWDNLFDDLEGQLENGLALEDGDLRAEEERLRLGRLTLRDRLVRLAHGEPSRAVLLTLVTGDRLTIVAEACGRDWLSGRDSGAAKAGASLRGGQSEFCVVAIAGIASATLSRADVESSLSEDRPGSRRLSERLGLNFVARDLCRRRVHVEVVLRRERVHGTIDRVGRDHLDLAIHERGTPRRESAVSEYRIVAFHDLVVVRVV